MFESGRLVSMDLVELNPALDKRNVRRAAARFQVPPFSVLLCSPLLRPLRTCFSLAL